MKSRIKMLKVKIKSLAAEARIIRLEESKCEGSSDLHCELHKHRVFDLRKEQRSSMLAYGFLRGRTYRQCELNAKTEPDWKRVARLVEKFGTADEDSKESQSNAFETWKRSQDD